MKKMESRLTMQTMSQKCLMRLNPIKEDSNRVKFMTMLIRKAAWVKKRGAISATVAKQEALEKLKAARNKLPKQYSKTEVFDDELLEILPPASRHGSLEDHQEELENVAEAEIFEEQRPMKSDLLVNSSHHSVVGDLRCFHCIKPP